MNHLRRVQERRNGLWAEAARNRWDFSHSPAAGLGWLPKGWTRERTRERRNGLWTEWKGKPKKRLPIGPLRAAWGNLRAWEKDHPVADFFISVALIGALGWLGAFFLATRGCETPAGGAIRSQKSEVGSTMGGCETVPAWVKPVGSSGQPPTILQELAPVGSRAGTCFGVEPPSVVGDGPSGLRFEEGDSGRGSNAECTKRPTGRCGSPPGAEPLPVGNPADRYPPLSAAERTAIEQVESSGDPAAWKKDEDARGIIQIRPIYVADANRILLRQGSGGQGPRRKPFTHDDAFDPAKAWEMFDVVTSYYIRAHGYADTFEVRARIHNGGGKGPTRKSTLVYWRKVQAAAT